MNKCTASECSGLRRNTVMFITMALLNLGEQINIFNILNHVSSRKFKDNFDHPMSMNHGHHMEQLN